MCQLHDIFNDDTHLEPDNVAEESNTEECTGDAVDTDDHNNQGHDDYNLDDYDVDESDLDDLYFNDLYDYQDYYDNCEEMWEDEQDHGDGGGMWKIAM